MWISIEKKILGTIIPLILYFDNFEMNNPIGTHRCFHKIGAVYFALGCLPDEYASQLENIFLAQFHNTIDYRNCDNKQIFWKLIEQLIELETIGITIIVNSKQRQVKFAILIMAGNSLAIHSAFGYYRSFNANFNCRACITDTKIRQSQIRKDPRFLRTEENYSTDVKTLARGIREECVFNKIPSFYVTRNIAFDPDHDILEEDLRYETAEVLSNFIKESQFFSLESLNNKIRFFDYGAKNYMNFPPHVKKEWLGNNQIMYTASEPR